MSFGYLYFRAPRFELWHGETLTRLAQAMPDIRHRWIKFGGASPYWANGLASRFILKQPLDEIAAALQGVFNENSDWALHDGRVAVGSAGTEPLRHFLQTMLLEQGETIAQIYVRYRAYEKEDAKQAISDKLVALLPKAQRAFHYDDGLIVLYPTSERAAEIADNLRQARGQFSGLMVSGTKDGKSVDPFGANGARWDDFVSYSA